MEVVTLAGEMITDLFLGNDMGTLTLAGEIIGCAVLAALTLLWLTL